MAKIRIASDLSRDYLTLDGHYGAMRRIAEGMHSRGAQNDPTIMQHHSMVDKKRPATAIVRQGAWVAYCPNCEVNYGGTVGMWVVGSANTLQPGHPMMCPECCDADIGGAWRFVIWPKDVEDINAVLGIRLVESTRNWQPPETVKDLRAENAEHNDGGLSLILATR